MKKKILSGLFALALLATAAVGVQESNKNDVGLNDLALANVEALANGEISSGSPCYNNGKYDIDKPKAVVCGSPCKMEPTRLAFYPTTSYCE